MQLDAAGCPWWQTICSQDPSPWDSTAHIQRWLLLLSQIFLEIPSQTHPEVCLLADSKPSGVAVMLALTDPEAFSFSAHSSLAYQLSLDLNKYFSSAPPSHFTPKLPQTQTMQS